LRDFIAKWAADSFANFARLSTLTSLRGHDAIIVTRRNIPPVRFVNFDVARDISRQLYLFGDNSTSRTKAENILTQKNIEALKRNDPTSYTEFICYALWALVMRNLQLASGCLTYALTLVPRDNASSPIRGDEALFLLSHTTRLQAKSISHISQARMFLTASEALFKESVTESSDHRDIRFVGEEFSLKCHELYFRAWDIGNSVNPAKRSPSNFRIEEIASQFDRGLEILSAIEAQSASEDVYITEYVKQQTLVNIVQLSLILSFGSTPRSDVGEGLLEIFPRSSDRAFYEKREADAKKIAQALVDHCQMLQEDSRVELPDASILALIVAAVGQAALNGETKAQFPAINEKSWIFSPIDHYRFEYLEKIWQRVKGRIAG
jgi:hypothetical protein